jgi:transcription antitermination factor NusG
MPSNPHEADMCCDTWAGGCVAPRRWYVAVTEPGQELHARTELLRRSEATGLACFLPLDQPRISIRLNRAGKEVARKVTPVPLLPGYLFVQADLERDRWQTIYTTPGFERLLGMDRFRPQPIPCAFVERLMRDASKAGVVAQPRRAMLAVGATVEVLQSNMLLGGARGEVEAVARDRVRIRFHGFTWDAWLPADQVEELPGGGGA